MLFDPDVKSGDPSSYHERQSSKADGPGRRASFWREEDRDQSKAQHDGMWNPFTSDPDGKFAFVRQPGAARVNLATLAQIVMAMLGPEGQNDDLKARVSAAVGKKTSLLRHLILKMMIFTETGSGQT